MPTDLPTRLAAVREALGKVQKSAPQRNADDWLAFQINGYCIGQIGKGDTADGIEAILTHLPDILTALETLGTYTKGLIDAYQIDCSCTVCVEIDGILTALTPPPTEPDHG